MKIFRGFHHPGIASACALTIGNFDGVHRGHQAMLALLNNEAAHRGVESCVLTFEPHPRDYFAGVARKPELAPARIGTLRDKLTELERCGVQQVVVLPFSARLAAQTPEAFINEVLVQGLGARYVLVGDDFRFGCDRRGDFALLQKIGAERGFGVTDTCTLEINGERVSSTRIRHLLEMGDFAQAETLLGKPYSISGRIAYGQQLGRKLGVPTANVHLRRYRSPLHGVFTVSARFVDGSVHQGVANVGVRPTVTGDKKPLLEVHLFDFSRKVYGAMIDVVFHTKLRDEKKFNSLDELQTQLQADIAQGQAFFRRDTAPMN